MRITRKGFTLVELLIVIGIIGVLGAMGLIGGKEANNIATATKIVEDFHIISAAMDMYYADNKSKIDADGGTEINAEKIVEALEAYIKKDSSKIVHENQKAGQFLVTVKPAAAAVAGSEGNAGTPATSVQWWLSYLLDDGDSGIAKILANKAVQEGFMASDVETKADPSDANKSVANAYEAGSGKTSVYYHVR